MTESIGNQTKHDSDEESDMQPASWSEAIKDLLRQITTEVTEKEWLRRPSQIERTIRFIDEDVEKGRQEASDSRTSPRHLHQLRMLIGGRVDLLDDRGGSISADLAEPAELAALEAHGDDGVAAATLGLGDEAADGVVARAVQQRREAPELAADDGLEHHAGAGGPVARAHRQAVDDAQHAHDAVARHVEHGRRDDAVGLGVAVQVLEVGAPGRWFGVWGGAGGAHCV
ncbi:hypothetical protein PpBr36_03765 [Pyricularia pennisetigena]|uniref:hypothetical protein n=1 Tax=Pyricularia pennisetigena TaxID=1578925 RepID=UPI001150FFCE|nr:hypothetical protein PpBr36_03765 [Pyricularia pennisetigena]TLS31159.1 hypothetical protein PpBr36_03765 [Pyricularia pennisetigena]